MVSALVFKLVVPVVLSSCVCGSEQHIRAFLYDYHGATIPWHSYSTGAGNETKYLDSLYKCMDLRS